MLYCWTVQAKNTAGLAAVNPSYKYLPLRPGMSRCAEILSTLQAAKPRDNGLLIFVRESVLFADMRRSMGVLWQPRAQAQDDAEKNAPATRSFTKIRNAFDS